MPLKKGTLIGLSHEKKALLIQIAENASAFPTIVSALLELKRNGVPMSKTTFKKYLKSLRPNNHLVNGDSIILRRKLQLEKKKQVLFRQAKMIEFVKLQARQGNAVSANMLQQLFGGEKKIASSVLAEIEGKRLSNGQSAVIRRTKSSRPILRKHFP